MCFKLIFTFQLCSTGFGGSFRCYRRRITQTTALNLIPLQHQNTNPEWDHCVGSSMSSAPASRLRCQDVDGRKQDANKDQFSQQSLACSVLHREARDPCWLYFWHICRKQLCQSIHGCTWGMAGTRARLSHAGSGIIPFNSLRFGYLTRAL